MGSAREGREPVGQGGLCWALTRPSVKLLQILIVWGALFLLFLCLLGAQDGCQGKGGWSSA